MISSRRAAICFVAMDVSLQLQRLIGRTLPESLLFEAPTVRELAKRIRARNGAQGGRSFAHLRRRQTASGSSRKNGLMPPFPLCILSASKVQQRQILLVTGPAKPVLAGAGRRAWAHPRCRGRCHESVRVIRGVVSEPRCGSWKSTMDFRSAALGRALHCAASVNFQYESERQLANAAGTLHVMELMDIRDVLHVLHISTAYVVGDALLPPRNRSLTRPEMEHTRSHGHRREDSARMDAQTPKIAGSSNTEPTFAGRRTAAVFHRCVCIARRLRLCDRAAKVQASDQAATRSRIARSGLRLFTQRFITPDSKEQKRCSTNCTPDNLSAYFRGWVEYPPLGIGKSVLLADRRPNFIRRHGRNPRKPRAVPEPPALRLQAAVRWA